jgi:DNA-binding Xre family transcriptional regulator
MTIADRLNRMMQDKGFRQTDLADVTGTSRAYVNKLCSGQIPNMGTLTLIAIVEAMGGTMTEFFEGE